MDGPGNSKSFGPFETMDAAVGAAPRAAAAVPSWDSVECVEVQQLSAEPALIRPEEEQS